MAWGFTRFNAGIDLRSEMENLLHGSSDVVQIGQWVIYRRYDLNRKSATYNEVTREGVEGAKYEYSDELLLTYKWNNVVSDPSNETDITPGQFVSPLVTFFFEYNVNPKEYDEIFEFEWEDNTVKPNISDIPKPYLARYDIKLVQTYRLDRGRKEFVACRALKDIVRH